MLYKIMVMLHLLGASIWIGGHAVLMGAVLPAAIRLNEPRRVLDFERGYGRLGLVALLLQLSTGFWLANRWIGDWTTLFSEPTPQGHLILSKLIILVMTVALATFTSCRVLPRIERGALRLFAVLAGVTTGLAVLLLIIGVGIRTGGLR